MSTVKLSSGYEIPTVGLGVYETPSDVTEDVVYKALKLGYRHVDSAQWYFNEKEVVKAIAKFLAETPEVKRSDIFYTTKLANDTTRGYEASKKTIAESIAIAKDIGYIDLMLVHTPLGTSEERLGEYKALQEAAGASTIRSIGVSNFGLHHLKQLLEWPELKIKPAINQIEAHPWMTRKAIVDLCRQNGIALEAWGPLTKGTRLQEPILEELGSKYNKTPAQILIRWSIEKGFITLPKSVKEERLKSNLEVFDFQLSPEDLKKLTHDDVNVSCAGWFDPTEWPLEMPNFPSA